MSESGPRNEFLICMCLVTRHLVRFQAFQFCAISAETGADLVVLTFSVHKMERKASTASEAHILCARQPSLAGSVPAAANQPYPTLVWAALRFKMRRARERGPVLFSNR